MNILLTSAGRRSYLVKYFKDALKDEGKVFASNSTWTPALQKADYAVITPLIYDKGYVQFLIEYCIKNNIYALISLFDIDLPVLSKSKKEFEKNGIKLIVSDYEVTQICNDKWKTFYFLNENGIDTPRTFLSIDAAKKKIDSGELLFPLIVKPRWGMGSIGIYQADNLRELQIFYEKTLGKIKKTYLKYESEAELENSVVIQEKLNGQEYGLDVVNDFNKNYITTFVKKKTAMRSGETDGAITEDKPMLSELGKMISNKLGHIANLDVDVFMTENNKPFVLEMNCRFGGHYPFSHLAGANVPLAIIKWLRGEIPEDSLFKIKYGVQGIKDIRPIILNSKVNQ